MAVRQEPSGTWAAYNNRQGRFRAGFATRAEAEAYDARQRAATSGHIDHARPKLKFGVLLDEYVEHIDGLRAQRTVHDARLIIKSSVPDSLKRTRVDRLTRHALQTWVDDMTRSGLSGSTVRRYWSSPWTWCIGDLSS